MRRKYEYKLRITRRFGVSDVSEATCLDRRVVVAKARTERELELAAQRTTEANGLLADSLRAICRVERRRECCSGLAVWTDCVMEANGFAQHHDTCQPRIVGFEMAACSVWHVMARGLGVASAAVSTFFSPCHLNSPTSSLYDLSRLTAGVCLFLCRSSCIILVATARLIPVSLLWTSSSFRPPLLRFEQLTTSPCLAHNKISSSMMTKKKSARYVSKSSIYRTRISVRVLAATRYEFFQKLRRPLLESGFRH